MPRPTVLIRQSRVFDLVVQGRNYAEICKQLDISEDTIARDMQAIGKEVQELARERAGEVLAVALATYQAVIDNAWREYRQAAQREREWYAGQLDFETESVATKTLALEGEEPDETSGGKQRPRKDAAAQAAIVALALESESQPLEVKRSRKTVRPALVNYDRRTWLALIVETTREMTELLGIKKLLIEHTGKGGGSIEVTTPALDAAAKELAEWRRQMSEQLLSSPSAPPTART